MKLRRLRNNLSENTCKKVRDIESEEIQAMSDNKQSFSKSDLVNKDEERLVEYLKPNLEKSNLTAKPVKYVNGIYPKYIKDC